VQAIAADLNAKNVKLKPEDLAAKRDAYDKGVKELKRLKTDLEDDLKKTDSTVTAKVVKGVYEIARKMGEEKQLTMIIQGNPQIIYLDKTADITDEVIKRYDSQYGR
jgi:outer membrane protein